MAEIHLIYTGPVEECGFVGPVTGNGYVCHPLVPFQIDPADAEKLLRKWPHLLKVFEAEQQEPQEKKRRARHTEAHDQETGAAGSDSDPISES